MQQHIEEEIAALAERDLIVDHGEKPLSFLELQSAVFDTGWISSKRHGVGEHCLISHDGLLTEDAFGEVHSIFSQQNGALCLFIATAFHLFEHDLNLTQLDVKVLLMILGGQNLFC